MKLKIEQPQTSSIQRNVDLPIVPFLEETKTSSLTFEALKSANSIGSYEKAFSLA